MAQSKGGAKGGGAKAAATVSGTKVSGAKSVTTQPIVRGITTASGQSVVRPIAGLGGGGIIIGGGFGNTIYGGGYAGYSGFSPYLSGYPFQSGIVPIDYGPGPLMYAYTPQAGLTYVDPTLNNVRGYPPSTMYPNASPRLYPGAIAAPGPAGIPPQELGPTPLTTTASVQVKVPTADTELWFNGVKTSTPGMIREFATPELAPGQNYTYELRAKFVVNGKEYDQTRSITLHAGSQIVVTISVDGRETLPAPSGIKI